MLFGKIFNHKLYNNYYPLVQEEDIIVLLQENIGEIRLTLEEIIRNIRSDIEYRNHCNIRKMKKVITFCGGINYRNLNHNQFIVDKMNLDMKLGEMIVLLEKQVLCKEKLMDGKLENITTDELNYVLRYMNYKRHKLFMLMGCFIIWCVVFVFLIFM